MSHCVIERACISYPECPQPSFPCGAHHPSRSQCCVTKQHLWVLVAHLWKFKNFFLSFSLLLFHPIHKSNRTTYREDRQDKKNNNSRNRSNTTIGNMIAKILCLTASGLASCYSHLPPPSSTDNRKTDKITDERHMRKLGGANVVTTAAAFLTLLQTTTYIYLMTYSKSSFLPAIQQLSEFERWHAVAAAVTVAGFALRKWSFMTLDRFFTVS